MRTLVDVWYPAAERSLLVLDTLSIHTPATLYEACEPAEVQCLVERLQWHSTPKHGRWLHVAEMERSGLARQCLDRRIPDMETLQRGGTAWERARNTAVVKVG